MRKLSWVSVISGLAVLLSHTSPTAAQPKKAVGDWDIRVGTGVIIKPTFEGSDRYRARPLPFATVSWRDTFSLDQGGLSAQFRRPNYRVGVGLTFDTGRDERNTGGIFANGDDRLRGLGDIDFALGLRGFAGWQLGPIDISASVIKFMGKQNDGILGQTSLSMPLPLASGLVIIPNVSLSWADDNYMNAYFSVSALQASRSRFTQFAAGSGPHDVRAGANLVYGFHPNWFANLNVSVVRLLGDSASSPISLSDTGITGMAFLASDYNMSKDLSCWTSVQSE